MIGCLVNGEVQAAQILWLVLARFRQGRLLVCPPAQPTETLYWAKYGALQAIWHQISIQIG